MEILFGVISNLLFCIINKIGIVLFGEILKGKDKNELQKEIKEKFILKSEKLSFDNLVEFFSLCQIKDSIEKFILSKALLQSVSAKNAKSKVNIVLRKDDLIAKLSTIYSSLYECEQSEIVLVKDCFEFIFSFCDKKLFEYLKKSEKATIYFINSHIDEVYNLVEEQLKNINDILKRDIEKSDSDFDNIRNKYHSILKERFSKAHIYLLDQFKFDKFYVPPTLICNPQNKLEETKLLISREYLLKTTWDKIFTNNNVVYIIGGAGYGKSLFLKKVINDYNNLLINNPSEYLIVFGELKMFFNQSNVESLSLEEFIRYSMRSNTLMGDEISLEFIRHYLNMGRCIILLDALDEVEKDKRNDLHEKIIAYFKNQNPENKICITSRDRGFIPEKNIEVFHIKPLNSREIELYVDNIIRLGKFDKRDKAAFMQQASILIRKGFLNSFLVLSLLLNIYKAERELPENKLDLYCKCFEYITVKREKEKTKDRFDWKSISLLMKDNTFMALSKLCYPNNRDVERNIIIEELTNIYKSKYSNEVETINAIEEFLKFCSDRTELFVPSNCDDKFKFFHRSFFEYFYSLNLFVNYTTSKELLEKFKSFDVDSEVFELTMSMFKQKAENRYQEILNLIFSEAELELKNGKEFTSFNILVLIMQIVDDVQYKERFFNLIIDYKKTIVDNNKWIHNLSVLSVLLIDFDEYRNKICEAYYKESIELLLNVLSIFLKYLDSNSHIIFGAANENDDNIEMNYERVLRFRRKPSLFFFELFVKNFDLQTLINSLNNEKLRQMGIRDKSLIKSLNSFKSKNLDVQCSILKNINMLEL